MKNIDYDRLTPMMKQYVDLKRENSDSILMFRMGDFYEMFLEDAVIASKELDIVLTSREAGLDNKVPMCGVPHHAVDNYINRLINKGYKVAMCDQLEDPKLAKGLVKRGVTRIITPGTNLDYHDYDGSNYLGSIYTGINSMALSYVDFSTGDLYITYSEGNYNDSNSILRNQISILEIKELVISSEINLKDIAENKNILVNNVKKQTELNEDFLKFYQNLELDNDVKFLIEKNDIMIFSLAQLHLYLKQTQFDFVNHIRKLEFIDLDKYMVLDNHTLYSLDIFSETDKKLEGTLLHLLDKTKTSMGYRKLRYFLEHPLKDKNQIILRHNIVDSLVNNLIVLDSIRKYLNDIYDIERILVKVSGQSNSPKDLIQLKKSFDSLPKLKDLIETLEYQNLNLLKFDPLDELHQLLDGSLIEDAPFSPKEGSVIKDGFSAELDELKSNTINSKTWILDYENELKKETGISKLRIKYNKILGFFIEVTKSHTDKIPEYFIRKQTLVNSERYFTEKLKSTEMTILNSKDKIDSLEYDIYEEIRNNVLNNYDKILKVADVIANIDVFSNFAYIAKKNSYTKPHLSNSGYLDIKNGRHPIVEKNVDIFIDNDTYIDIKNNFILLTGPNMAGKSTYMRQIALISIMMQIGSFVPCESAILPVFDRIFTRIGAHDNLYMGESTFMVEMKEMADIIENATENSLIILDEVGRGTSTYDGLSLAKSLIEYIVENINAKTIFATHFHELTDLQYKYSNIKNQTMQVREKDGDIQFLRKVIDGTSDKSYGIHVATLAGIKESIIRKAKMYLADYESKASSMKQLEFISEENLDVEVVVDTKYDSIIDTILDLDINNMSPIESLIKIQEIKEMIKKIDEN
ncbi:MAG: DNA mismatch repair protein MutS [Tissierellia bacterium]|nr:DNA mismatch repair protein MutS [Tissierellia bacterium]